MRKVGRNNFIKKFVVVRDIIKQLVIIWSCFCLKIKMIIVKFLIMVMNVINGVRMMQKRGSELLLFDLLLV